MIIAQLDPRQRRAVVLLIALLVGAAWAALAFASLGSSWASHLGHHSLLGESERPIPISFALFVPAWLVMTAAMMLPSSLAMFTGFARLSRGRHLLNVLPLTWVFASGYLVAWTLFGLGAFTADLWLHYAVDRIAALDKNSTYLGAAVLLTAGVYQFTPLKTACLSQCRSPLSFLLNNWRPGPGGAFRLGLRHGVFCVGCCWALMLIMFAVGMANLFWMLALALVMFVEKVTRWGGPIGTTVGVTLVILGLIGLLRPEALGLLY